MTSLRLTPSLTVALLLTNVSFALDSSPLQTYAVVQTLTGPDAGGFDDFGFSVDVYSKTLIAGAINVRHHASDTGAAYIFEKNDAGTWLPTTALLARDGQHNDAFGYKVAINGLNALVSAPYSGDFRSKTEGEGSAYFFRNTSGESWDEISRFVPPVAVDNFGYTLDMEESYAAVAGMKSIRTKPGVPPRVGFIQIYKETGESWQEFQAITVGGYQSYVTDLSMNKGRLALGVSTQSSAGTPRTNEVRIYESSPSGFRLASTIPSPNEGYDDRFGWSVTLDGDQIMIGASTDEEHGAAYIYEQGIDSNWEQSARLVASDSMERYHFGSEVALEGDLALVNSWQGPDSISEGVVYVFERSSGQWSQKGRLESGFFSFGDQLHISNGIGFIGSGVNAPGAIDIVSRIPESTSLNVLLVGLSSLIVGRRFVCGARANCAVKVVRPTNDH